jgi:hypothetical protein
VQKTKAVSGNLAPFDEDLTVVMRGPMNVYNIAVYQPDNSTSATWKRTSSWASGNAADNLVFMNNMGGGASGTWSSESRGAFSRLLGSRADRVPVPVCGGASQSYASGDFASAAASPNQTYGSYISPSDEVVSDALLSAKKARGAR